MILLAAAGVLVAAVLFYGIAALAGRIAVLLYNRLTKPP